MRKTLLFIFLTLFTLFTLSSCGNEEITMKVDGEIYNVDFENRIIKDDEYSYSFTITKYASSIYIITITYPNDTKYTYDHTTNVPKEIWTAEYDSKYANPSSLVGIVKSNMDNYKYSNSNNNNTNNNKNSSAKLMIIGASIIIILIGAFLLLFPEAALELNIFRHRWMVKDYEPSDTEINYYRVFGGFTIVLGIIFMIVMLIII